MRNRILSFVFMALAMTLLTGCPPPPKFETWKKPGTTENDVKSAMRACGFSLHVDDSRTTSDNETVKRYQCMKKNGFKARFEICDFHKSVPACVEEKQGYPVSIEQLESLPFFDDPGFARARFESSPAYFVPWHPAGSSLHFRDRHANHLVALEAMYECGYPNPLGSGSTVSIGEAASAQTCMQRKGFIPVRSDGSMMTMIPVCTQYPVLSACSSP